MRTILVLVSLLLCVVCPRIHAAPTPQPNILLIYSDDLGYGDLGCYGATKVGTPNIDRLAGESLRFTDAHSSSATCTPSRYALLTGEYPWRKKGTGVLPGNANMIIQPGRATLPSVLHKAGYMTAVIGKWHLGLGDGEVDWNSEIKPGPLEIGFDYSFILPATGDRVPCVYVENHRVAGLDPKDPIQVKYGEAIGEEPTGKKNPELLKLHPSHGHDMAIVNGISRIGFMTGGKSALWKDEDIADVLTQKATEFLEKNKEKPFFLYFSTHDIHVPRVPHPRFAGKSGLGPRGDAITQLDWTTGQLLEALNRLKLADNTIVIFSSDNGPVVDDGYKDQAVEKLNGHQPAGPFRGGKYSAFEGGTRVPMLVRWPRQIEPGTSDALVCHMDFLASLAALVGQNLGADDAPDSFNVLDAILGKSKVGREHLVEQAGPLALRKGSWKYIAPGKGVKVLKNTGTETGNSPEAQLYNLAEDPSETKNMAAANSERLAEMRKMLLEIREKGHSR